MADLLAEIIAHKYTEVAASKHLVSLGEQKRLAKLAAPARDFFAALQDPQTARVIAECKQRSPSRGLLKEHYKADETAKLYEQGGAAAISVLTDAKYFGGKLADLVQVRAAVKLPVLRKDFIISEYQIYEARAAGADSFLLISGPLNPAELEQLIQVGRSLGMEPLIESHNEAEFAAALTTSGRIFGINNRNLKTFAVDLEAARSLAQLASGRTPPPVLVCESGIHNRADIELMRPLGYQAFLIGEALITSPDPATALRTMIAKAHSERLSEGPSKAHSKSLSKTSKPTPVDLYKQAGVDTEKGDRLVDWLQQADLAPVNPHATPSPSLGSVVSGIGGFAALFRPNFSGMKDPLLVTGTDGVGTKVLLGMESGHLQGLGVDLVAMCVNDLYTVGGRPLFFLDYYATGHLDEEQFKQILRGIKQGCQQSAAALLGGETAEMPGLYAKGHFDLAGFVVGVVDGASKLGPERVRSQDRLYALASSGFHSNGYSLVRHWLKDAPASAQRAALISNLMIPTKIYHEVPALLEAVGPEHFHALANITGGGISGNLPRVMPHGSVCHVSVSSLRMPKWMSDFITNYGGSVLAQEAVFNLGCGMIASVAEDQGSAFEKQAAALGLDVYPVGTVHLGETDSDASVVFHS